MSQTPTSTMLNSSFLLPIPDDSDSYLQQIDWDFYLSPYSSLPTFDSPSPASTSSASTSPSATALRIPSEKPSRTSKSHQRAPGYVPRPQNSWILFRSARFRELADSPEGKIQQGGLSKIIAAEWKSLNPRDKQYWDDLAAEKAKEHKKRYPDYKFQPKRKVTRRVAVEQERRAPQYANAIEVQSADFGLPALGVPADWMLPSSFLAPIPSTALPHRESDIYFQAATMMGNDGFGFEPMDYLWFP